jgi:hypothetical protein
MKATEQQVWDELRRQHPILQTKFGMGPRDIDKALASRAWVLDPRDDDEGCGVSLGEWTLHMLSEHGEAR